MGWWNTFTNWAGSTWNNITGKTAQMEYQKNAQIDMAKKQSEYAVEGMQNAGLNPALGATGGISGSSAMNLSSGGGGGPIQDLTGIVNAAANIIHSAKSNNDNYKDKDLINTGLKIANNVMKAQTKKVNWEK